MYDSEMPFDYPGSSQGEVSPFTYGEYLMVQLHNIATALMQMQDHIGTMHDASVNEYEDDPDAYRVNEAILGHNLGSLSVGPRRIGTRLLAALASAEDIAWDAYHEANKLALEE